MDYWEQEFKKIGAFWFHDGNRNRPYARLTSGKISNGFFNGGKVAEHARLFGQACEALSQLIKKSLTPGPHTEITVIGAAMGAIPLALRVAEALDMSFAYAEKEGDRLEFKRFFFDDLRTMFLPVEDTLTTGGTLLKLADAARRAHRLKNPMVIERALVLCNRSGQSKIGEFNITALVDRPMQTWDEGHNPFTPDGKELVEPVRPKSHWGLLTSAYD